MCLSSNVTYVHVYFSFATLHPRMHLFVTNTSLKSLLSTEVGVLGKSYEPIGCQMKSIENDCSTGIRL
jgi:hypothetical protein